MAVLPKTKKGPLPVVIYLHGVGGDLTGSGNDLRQMAEMGLAAVGMEYNQTNDLAFEAQFEALNRHLRRQKWADTNAIAWIGFSLGAQAAEIVARHLRERVTIAPDRALPEGIDSIWRQQITNERGFQRIYVAALRSAGIPGRLAGNDAVEVWDGSQWRAAPRPVIESWPAER